MKSDSFTSDTIDQNTEHLPPDQRELIRWVFAYMQTRGMTRSDVAREAGISDSTLYRIFDDSYRQPKFTIVKDGDGKETGRVAHPKADQRVPLDSICEQLAAWKLRQCAAGKVANANFVNLTVAEKILWHAGRIADNHVIGLLLGDGQVGKTTALKHIAATREQPTVYKEIPPGCRVLDLLGAIANGLGATPSRSYGPLLENVLSKLTADHLIILDDAHRIFSARHASTVMQSLDVVCHLWNSTKCSILICGNTILERSIFGRSLSDKKADGKNWKNTALAELPEGYTAQLGRRARSYILRVPTQPPKADLNLLAARYGLPPATGDAEAICQRIASDDGIGVFSLRLADGATVSRNRKCPPSWDDFMAAFRTVENCATGAIFGS